MFFMDFAEALEFSRKFRICHPKIFIGFSEWGIMDTETEGYVILADSAFAKEPHFNQLEDYVKTHKLRIDHSQDYLMICTIG